MPQRKSSPEPEVLTLGKVVPVVIVAAIFDIVRLFFEFFWFFGPAAAGLYCTVKFGESLKTYSLGLLGLKAAAALCGAGAVTGGVAISEVAVPFGVVMAMATGFAGWLIIGGWLTMLRPKMIAENVLWFAGSLLISEIPFLGSVPAISLAVWKMCHRQIKKEKAIHKKWEEENAEMQLQERNERVAQVLQLQAAQVAEREQVEAANDEQYMQEQTMEDGQTPERRPVGRVPGVAASAANDEIPREYRKAA